MITITIKHAQEKKSASPRVEFWNKITNQELETEQISKYEDIVANEFPIHLQKHLEKIFKQAYEGTGRKPGRIGKIVIDDLPLSTQKRYRKTWESKWTYFYDKIKEQHLKDKIPTTIYWTKLDFKITKEGFKYSSLIMEVGIGIEAIKLLKSVFDGNPNLFKSFLEAFVPYTFAELDYPIEGSDIIKSCINETSFGIQLEDELITYFRSSEALVDETQKFKLGSLLSSKTNKLIWLISNFSLTLPVILGAILLVVIWLDNREQMKQNQEQQRFLLDSYKKRIDRYDMLDSIIISRMAHKLIQDSDSIQKK